MGRAETGRPLFAELDAFIDVRLLRSTDPESFQRLVPRLPAVREMALPAGRIAYQVPAASRDADDLDTTFRAMHEGGPPGPRPWWSSAPPKTTVRMPPEM